MKACQRHCLTYYLFCFFTYYILAITLIYLCTCSIWTEKAMATHSSTLAWKVPWTEEPGGLQSMRSRRGGHDWATSLSLFTFMRWRGKWQPTPVFLPGEFQGQVSLVGCRLWGCWESDTAERPHFHFSLSCVGEGNGSPLQYYCLENPRDGGAWLASIYGIAQSRTRLNRLSSSSSSMLYQGRWHPAISLNH